MLGSLDILSCGHGHLKLTFNSDDPVDTDKARRAVLKLMRQGCVIFIEQENDEGKLTMVRVHDFDAKTDCYIVSDVPSETGEHPTETTTETATDGKEKPKATKKTTKAQAKKATKKVKASKTKATVVPMRSGG